MGSIVYLRHPFRGMNRPALLVLTGLAATLGGCSADVARFDFGHNRLNDPTQTAAIPVPSEPMRRSNLGADAQVAAGQYSEGGAYVPPQSDRSATATPPASNVQMAALPDVAQPRPPVQSAVQTRAAAPAPVVTAEKGEQIEVQSGDTLYKLSKQHQVAVSELMSVNGLSGPNLKPGQKLYLPANHSGSKSAPRAAAVVAAAAPAPADLPSDWKGSYTVKQGDALYNIARQHKVKLEDLQRFNGITDVRKVKPGMVLRMPGAETETVASAATPAAPQAATSSASVSPPPEAVKDAAVAAAPAATISSTAPAILNGSTLPAGEKVAAVTPPTKTATDASPAAATPAAVTAPIEPAGTPGKLRWPVQGKVISPFGPRTDGTHNDGIDIAVPMGTDVHAAEDGTVAYAGSELKGYGNLILVRHDNGLVTTYAYNEELLVKRGDRIKRGQVIAKAGKSGSVDQPQVHFEVRQGQKPVDPTPYLDKI